MKDIEPILVTFPDAKYSEMLICSLLKLLGCVIPGEVFFIVTCGQGGDMIAFSFWLRSKNFSGYATV